jgi:nicotinate-nucleotide adenylyltransferase
MIDLKKRVGIIGGTFDPVHMGHLVAADQVLFYNQLDEVWFMPAYLPPHKTDQPIMPYQHRVAMLELAAELKPEYKVCTIESERETLSYTYETMIELQKRYPEFHFSFIIGADIFSTLTKWHRINELIEIVEFIGLDRISCDEWRKESESAQAQLATDERSILSRVRMTPMPQLEISSSLIREYVRDGRGLSFLVPDAVEKYIKEHQLYVEAD